MTTQETDARDAVEDYARTAVPEHAKRGSGAVSAVLFGIVTAFFFPAVGGAYYQSYGAAATWIGLGIGFAVLIALVLPVAAAASRQGLTAELITRGCGYGYVGTVLTTLIYAVTFIILAAVEAQILSNAAAQLLPFLPVEFWYVFVGLLFIPLTWYGMKLLPKMMWVSLPVYILLVGAALIVAIMHFGDTSAVGDLVPSVSGGPLGVIGVLAGLSGIVGLNPFEASDYTRFIRGDRFWKSSLTSVVLPYAVMFFVAYPLGIFFTIATGESDPAIYFPALLGLGLGVLLAWVSQVRINLTSVHLGSIALTSANERALPWRLGRRFWTVVICALTILLMYADVLGNVLVFLEWNGVFLLAWAGSILADLLIVRKALRIVPETIECRESHIRKVNPVGVTALVAGCGTGSVLLALAGPVLSGLSAYIGFAVAATVHVVLAWLTKGKYYAQPSQARAAHATEDMEGAPQP